MRSLVYFIELNSAFNNFVMENWLSFARTISRFLYRRRSYSRLFNALFTKRNITKETIRNSTNSFGRLATLGLLPTVHAAFGFSGSAKTVSDDDDRKIVAKADDLYLSNEVEQLYQFLINRSDSKNAEILWRLARATCDKAKNSKDSGKKKQLMYDAFAFAERAIAADDRNFACHKWYAIMLDFVGEYQGTKERISKAYEIKEHFEKAIELNPKDATSIHLLGYWCFVFADLPWYQQKIASVLFATPPSSSYEEALKYFLQAEATDPNFYSMNLLMLGKTYLRLDDKERAKKFLQRAKEFPVRTEDDRKANAEATELLKKL